MAFSSVRSLINNSKKILDGQIDDIRQQYKSNTFEISFNGNIENFKANINKNFEIIKTDINNNASDDEHIVRVKLNNGSTPNDLLSMALPTVQIKSFNELIPSMNDIFIKVVEEKKN